MRLSVPGFYGHAVSISNSRCERMLCWVPSAGFCWYHGLGSGDSDFIKVILPNCQECVSNVAWGIDEPIHMFIEFANSLIIAPGHQIVGRRISRKQKRITCTNNFTMSLRLNARSCNKACNNTTAHYRPTDACAQYGDAQDLQVIALSRIEMWWIKYCLPPWAFCNTKRKFCVT